MVVPERIEREILIEAPIDVVWAVLTEPEHVAGWFSDSVEIDLRPGGEATFDWREHGPARAWVERVEPPRNFAFRWVRAVGEEQRQDNSTLVEFTSPQRVITHACESSRPVSRARLVGGQEGEVRGREHQGWQLELDELLEYISKHVRPAPKR